MLTPKTVLCPTDFSPLSVEALRLAARLSERFGARLILHHSVDTFPPILVPGVEVLPTSQSELIEEQEENARKLLEEQSIRFPRLAGGDSVVTRGHAPSAILELSRERAADLIVMGAHGSRGIRHLMVGSTTERVLARARCPVLAVRSDGTVRLFEDAEEPPRRGLVAVDLSEHSCLTIEYALGLAEVLPIRLDLIHVLEPASRSERKDAGETESGNGRLEEALRRLRQCVPDAKAGEIRLEVRSGAPAAEILRRAAETKAALIIMGTRRERLLERIAPGKTSHAVLRASRCPVWYVQGRGFQAGAGGAAS